MLQFSSFAKSAFVLCALALPSLQASSVIFNLTSPTGNLGTSETYTDPTTHLSITLNGYDCGKSNNILCAAHLNTSYLGSMTSLYGSSDGIGMANTLVGTQHEIPNTEFVQVDFSSLIGALGAANVKDIKFTVTDIVVSWSAYVSSAAGQLQGAGGQIIVNNAGTSVTSGMATAAQLGSNKLLSFVAGTNCDVVLTSITVDYVPEPATYLITGFALVALAAAARKLRGR